MKYKQLGNSGLIVSELTFGCMLFGEGDYYGMKYTINQAKANDLVAESIEKGINIFDTADMYNNGVSEEILGKALGNRRKEVLISTKTSFRAGNQAFNAGINYKHIVEQVQGSLQRLGTDYIDVLLLHNDDPITPIDETLRAIEQIQQRGMVRYAGISNFSAWKTATMLQRQKDLHYAPFVASQMHYSLLNREVEAEFVPMSLHHGLGMMVWSPLSSGFLTGKYTRENPEPADARLNTFDLGLFDRNWAYGVVDKLKEIAQKYETAPATVAIAWLLSKKVVSTVLVGISKPEQFPANLAGADLVLAPEDLALLDEITAPTVRYPNTFANLQDPILKVAKSW
ncbi:MAG: aldo/keto reductase [Thermoflexibacter sp.]|nr:aldo/keto reductase [Thermoflexibacter sp.]